MLHRVRLLFAFASLCVPLALASDAALAQTASSSSSGGTTGGGSENISSPIPNPNRALFQNGQYVDVTNNPRPQNLNPTGVNFSDCEQDLKLTFPLVVTGFRGGSGIEVWAGTTDCTSYAARGNGQVPTCWRLSPQASQLLDPTTTSISYTVFARDVMRYLGTSPPNPPVYDPNWHSSAAGESACHVQATDAAVTVNVYFVPIQVSASVGQPTGTAYQFNLITDTVAPPAPNWSTDPTKPPLAFGDTMLTVNWTSPGNDPDIAGFAVWSDPPSGGASTGGGCSCGSSPGSGGANSYVGDDASDAAQSVPADASELVCPADAMVSDGASPLDGASDGASDAAEDAVSDVAEEPIEASLPDASTDAEADAQVDAQADGGAPPGGDAGATDAGDGGLPPGCHYENVGGGGACNSYNLTGHTFLAGSSSSSSGGTIDSGIGTGTGATDGSTTAAFAPAGLSVEDLTSEGGTGDDGGGGTALAGGGISEIPPQYKAGEVDDRTATSMLLTGLTNGVTYTVVVTSIDGSGNVGPPSPTQCEQPRPVNDFWATYKQNGGGASGCALEGTGGATQLPVFGGALVALAALVRRRRRRRS